MHADSARAHRQRPSPATGWLLAALVLLLGGLPLLLMGCDVVFKLKDFHSNFYGCEVTCTSGFGIGAQVEFPAGGNVNSSPGGAFGPQEAAGSQGTIAAGPGSPANTNEIWWQVQFVD